LGNWGGEDPKRETNKWSAPALGQGDEAEVRHLESGSIRDYTVYGICSLNVFTTEY